MPKKLYDSFLCNKRYSSLSQTRYLRSFYSFAYERRRNSPLKLLKLGRGTPAHISHHRHTGSLFAKLSEEVDANKAFPRFI